MIIGSVFLGVVGLVGGAAAVVVFGVLNDCPYCKSLFK